jgi:hypothetical protein
MRPVRKRARRRPRGWADEPLTKAQIRELERRVEDARAPHRYIIVNRLTPTFVFHYNVSDDVWALDEQGATFFKRIEAARAILRFVRMRRLRQSGVRGRRFLPGPEIIEVRVPANPAKRRCEHEPARVRATTPNQALQRTRRRLAHHGRAPRVARR